MSLDHLVLHPQSPDPGWTESQLNYKFMPKYECDYFITLRRIDYSCKLSRISINHVCMVYNRPLNKKTPSFEPRQAHSIFYISEFVNSRNLCERSEPPTRLKRKEICEHRKQIKIISEEILNFPEVGWGVDYDLYQMLQKDQATQQLQLWRTFHQQ